MAWTEGQTVLVVDRKQGLPDVNRVSAFSDGVYAVAMTLLILNIQPPSTKTVPGQALASELFKQWPQWISYLSSFMIVGIGWVNHHQLFRYIVRADVPLLALNLLLLLSVTILPFPTALLANYINDPDGQRVAALFYGANLELTTISFLLLWLYASRRHLIDENITVEAIRFSTRRRLMGIGLVTVALALVFVNVPLAILLYLAVCVSYLVTSRDPRLPEPEQ